VRVKKCGEWYRKSYARKSKQKGRTCVSMRKRTHNREATRAEGRQKDSIKKKERPATINVEKVLPNLKEGQ